MKAVLQGGADRPRRTEATARSITCPVCARTSWHPVDVELGYCGACHAITNGVVTRPCLRCEGCGQVATSDGREPWTAWATLPPASSLAVRLGLVRPQPCPECHGAKRVPA